MGHLLIDSSTKGFTELNALALTPVENPDCTPDGPKLSTPLGTLMQALRDSGCVEGKPTEILMVINGDREKAFTLVVDRLDEIQEILQWTVGRD